MNLTTTMEDSHKLQNIPSFKLSRYSSSARDSDAGDDLRYTSLKDILLNSPSYSGVNDFNEFNSSNISIRNELVKRAASAYLQSAAILVSRNESGFVGFWERLRIKLAALRSRWCDCFHRIFGFFSFALD
ncbi:putative E3 ubiquitin-protein ligase arkadia-A [Cucumis melo var. makuwa]|uniref:E3 ubiquitin-protein ligase arkadia-A n=2 Tax=Cucumis melo TaxID=3656 RepID=A0A5A7UBK0_CUCMM|nr:putative E3 ubiquitin-protein ligase arkadia-A [Cucumis melo var. makuwa]